MARIASKYRTFLVNHLDLPAATGVPDAKWEAFQIDMLDDSSPLRIELKSRQIAYSWTSAAEAVAHAILDGESTIFVSISYEEAQEKVKYARAVLDALTNYSADKLLQRDNRLGLELKNGARLISNASKAPRGKARFRVVLDEFAHVNDAAAIYEGTLPIISKGGVLRIGSSPLGASGMFWEIYSESLRPYPDYNRVRTPWWHVQAFCNNIIGARKAAEFMTTEERVAQFGTDRIKLIYQNAPADSFANEYECLFIDEQTSWLSWSEILSRQDAEIDCAITEIKGNKVENALQQVDILAAKAFQGKIKGTFFVGIDIGRKRNATEIQVVSLTPGTGQIVCRLMITLDDTQFSEQEQVIQKICQKLRPTKVSIDQSGLGLNIAETLMRQYPGVVQGLTFTNPVKASLSADMKTLFHQARIVIPVHKALHMQLHSIKKRISGVATIFEADKHKAHHADMYWALAMAASEAMKLGEATPFSISTKNYGANIAAINSPTGARPRQQMLPNKSLPTPVGVLKLPDRIGF